MGIAVSGRPQVGRRLRPPRSHVAASAAGVDACRHGRAGILAHQPTVQSLPDHHARVVCLDADRDQIACEPDSAPSSGLHPDHLFYAIYTSGSTGRPKGIGLSHRVLIEPDLLEPRHLALAKGMLQFASLGFDASFHEMFAAWCSGRVVVMIPDGWRRMRPSCSSTWASGPSRRRFCRWSSCSSGPSTPRGHADRLACFKDIVTTGEQLLITPPIRELFNRLPDCTLHNHYGPSETHVVTALTLGADPAIVAGASVDRRADLEHADVRPGPGARAGARGRDGRAVHCGRHAGAGLPEPARSDGRAVRGRSPWARAGRPDVPHRRPRPLAGRRRRSSTSAAPTSR